MNTHFYIIAFFFKKINQLFAISDLHLYNIFVATLSSGIFMENGVEIMSKKLQSDLLLLLTAMIWGSAFVAQKAGATLEPFTYNGIRNLVGALALVPVILIFSRGGDRSDPAEYTKKKSERKTLIKGGIACGIALGVASSLQQFGLYFDTDAGKAGFITTLYIVIVPVLGLFLGKRVRPIIWLCVLMGAVGFYFLTMAGKGSGFSITTGDLFVLLCAVAFSCHILIIDHFSPKCDGVKLSCIQFLTAGVGCCILMFIFESPDIGEILDCWGPILYAGVLSSGVGYTLQIIGQKHAEPTSATLILSLESVFAVLTGIVFAGEKLTVFEVIGCVIIFIAVIIAQLPSKSERLKG